MGIGLALLCVYGHVQAIVHPRPLAPAELRQLAERGYCVARDWVSPDAIAAIRADALALGQTDRARHASVGTGERRALDERIRNSRLCPLIPPPNPRSGSPDLRSDLEAAFASLREELCAHAAVDGPLSGARNGAQYGALVPLAPFESELAYLLYPDGGFYARHRDTPAARDGWLRVGRADEDGGSWQGFERRREVSVLLYLNAGWDAAQWGGQLRVYHDRADDGAIAPGAHEDVSPEGGTLVLMRSAHVEHEVLRTARERECVVGWFRTTRFRPSATWA